MILRKDGFLNMKPGFRITSTVKLYKLENLILNVT